MVVIQGSRLLRLLFLCMLDDDVDVGSWWEEKYDGRWLDNLYSW